MTGFEPRISGIRNNCSAKWATTTAQILPKCQNFDKSGHTCDAQIEASKNLEAGFSKNKTFYLIIRKKKKKQDQILPSWGHKMWILIWLKSCKFWYLAMRVME